MGRFATGSGPGVITADGCAVEVYRRLPAGPTPGIVHAAVPVGAGILELGAGAGRVTHPLLRLGHPVVAVDDSAEMLAHVEGARTVVSPIEELDLGEEFDVVLLGSHLVNHPDADVRSAFLQCCRRHVRAAGSVLVERHAPEWFDTAAAFERTADGATHRMRDVVRPAPGVLEAVMEYEIDGDRWTHAFRCERLDDPQLVAALGEAGLVLRERLTADGSWVRAVPRSRAWYREGSSG